MIDIHPSTNLREEMTSTNWGEPDVVAGGKVLLYESVIKKDVLEGSLVDVTINNGVVRSFTAIVDGRLMPEVVQVCDTLGEVVAEAVVENGDHGDYVVKGDGEVIAQGSLQNGGDFGIRVAGSFYEDEMLRKIDKQSLGDDFVMWVNSKLR